jgi:hypothetical protein
VTLWAAGCAKICGWNGVKQALEWKQKQSLQSAPGRETMLAWFPRFAVTFRMALTDMSKMLADRHASATYMAIGTA